MTFQAPVPPASLTRAAWSPPSFTPTRRVKITDSAETPIGGGGGGDNIGGGGGGDTTNAFGGYDVPAWLVNAWNSGADPEATATALTMDQRIAAAAICSYASFVPLIGPWLSIFCFMLSKLIGAGANQGSEGGVSPNFGKSCDNGRGYIGPEGWCNHCEPGWHYDEASQQCVEGCPPDAPNLSPTWGCVPANYNQPCTLADGGKGVISVAGDCSPDGCGDGLRYDLESGACIPDGTIPGNINDKPGPDYCAEFGTGYEPVWDSSSGLWSCGEKCRKDEVRGQDGYCFCRSGYVRQNPNDPTSPCVPSSSPDKPKPSQVKCPPSAEFDPGSGTCVEKKCPDGQVADKATGACVPKKDDKPTGGGEKKTSYVGILAGLAILGVAGGLVAYGMKKKTPEEEELERRVQELKAQGMSEDDARRQAEQEQKAKGLGGGAPAPKQLAANPRKPAKGEAAAARR